MAKNNSLKKRATDNVRSFETEYKGFSIVWYANNNSYKFGTSLFKRDRVSIHPLILCMKLKFASVKDARKEIDRFLKEKAGN